VLEPIPKVFNGVKFRRIWRKNPNLCPIASRKGASFFLGLKEALSITKTDFLGKVDIGYS